MRYTRSFYWALSTMTVVCFGDVTPQTDYTTCFVVIMTIIGFFVIANIIGNISDLLSRMDADVAILKEKLDLFEHYASQHQLPQKLADRVRKYLTHVYYSQKGVETTSVIAELPKSLRNEVTSLCEIACDLCYRKSRLRFLVNLRKGGCAFYARKHFFRE